MDDDAGHFRNGLPHRQLVALDCVVAVAYPLALLALAIPQPQAALLADPPPAWCRVLVLAGTGLPLALRRRWPLPVFAVVLTMSVVSVLLGVVHDAFVGAAYALYPVALTAPTRRWVSVRTVGALSAGLLVASVVVGVPPQWLDATWPILIGAALLGGVWTVGQAVRERRAYAVRAAEQLADRAVAQERLRIARELHDVVAHSMGLIAVQAGVANHVLRTSEAARPDSPAEVALTALRVIETTSRDALVEMRHLLGVLRSGTDAEPGPDLRPAPGLGGLTELAGQAELAGVQVDLDVRGADQLPDGLGLSVYRIVQEALTNVVKHAAPARCRVAVAVSPGAATVQVVDDGPGTGRPTDQLEQPGHGLIGMRERVTMYGGTFAAGPHPDGGFGIHAWLPYQRAGRMDGTAG